MFFERIVDFFGKYLESQKISMSEITYIDIKNLLENE